MKFASTSIIVLVSAAVLLLTGCEPQPVKTESGTEANARIDPQAMAVLKSMSETLDGAKSFSCRVHQIYDVPSSSGQLVQSTRNSDVLVKRPDRMTVTTTGYDFEKTFYYDGPDMTIVDVKKNVYAKYDKAPRKIEDMLDFLAEKYHLVMPLADVMFPQSYKVMTAGVTSGEYLGKHKCGKHLCHHLAFQQPEISWQIWIDAGEKPLLRKLMIIYKNQPGMPRYVSVLRRWNLSPEISKDAFVPKIPAGAGLVTLDEMIQSKKEK